MDFHILIVVSCVFLASLVSLLFINKFFRRKTYEEVIAEKKALTEKINSQTKAALKKPKKLQQLKKEIKREKKQLQRQQHQQQNEDSSDAHNDQLTAENEQPNGLSKTHVEFEPDPEVLNEASILRRSSNAESNTSNKSKSKKDKKGAKGGILINKHEPVVVKENLVVEESLNQFDIKPPKDVVELKKQEKEKKDETKINKKDKHAKKEKSVADKPVVVAAVETPVEAIVITKEVKQQEEKVRQVSPKNQPASNNNKSKQNKKQKESAATKEIVQALDKLSDNDTVGVQLLMNLFRRAELNRSEIQILIDYLLNKQQDMPTTHSEWSDDIVQKLKRQLEEKEKALADEQEASIGIQAKLRELRAEMNSERVQISVSAKAYTEKLQAKDQEISALSQELQAVNDKMVAERQQFQAKLVHEKQAQELISQLQLLQSEVAHKDKCINDLTVMVNASRQAVEELQQKNEIIKNQAQQIATMEQQRDELEEISNNRIFELEQAKMYEAENNDRKVEICNLQNALESTKADLAQSCKDLEAVTSELKIVRNVELSEKQNEIQALQSKNSELLQQLASFNSRTEEQSKEQSGLQVTLDALKSQLTEKEKQLNEFSKKNAELLQQIVSKEATAQQLQQQQTQQHELQKVVESLQADVASKHQQLQQVEQTVVNFTSREKELLQQLQEQKEKNNDLRLKNWKLVEALQNAESAKQNKTKANLVQQEQLLAAQTSSHKPAVNSQSTLSECSPKDQKLVHDLFQRLYPDAVKACESIALSASFDQWIETVLATQLKQSSFANNNKSATLTHTSNESSGGDKSSNFHNSTHNSYNDNNNLLNSEARSNNSNNRISSNNNNSSSSSNGDNAEEVQKLRTQNNQLRAQNDELTNIVTKTSNTLSELESQARAQDEHWRSVVRSKDEQIYSLQHSNGEQDI